MPAVPIRTCPICDGTRFLPGPAGRLGRGGQPPRCAGCDSFERHRALRVLVEALRQRERFLDGALLEISASRVAARGWFREAVVVRDATQASDSLRQRANGAFLVVLSVHALNRAPDHRALVRETLRVLAREGFACFTLASPQTRAVSEDLAGGPGADLRIFGRDFEGELRSLAEGAHVLAVTVPDPVTGQAEWIYFVTRDFGRARKVLNLDLDVRMIE